MSFLRMMVVGMGLRNGCWWDPHELPNFATFAVAPQGYYQGLREVLCSYFYLSGYETPNRDLTGLHNPRYSMASFIARFFIVRAN